MLDIQPLLKSDAREIVRWNEGEDENFLIQWAGCGYEYPITIRQIIDRLDASFYSDFRLYRIQLDDRLIGTIELMRINPIHNTAKLGRFLIDPAQRGKGYGTAVLARVLEICFSQLGYDSVGLTVFDFNLAALRCYQKAGFCEVEQVTRPNGWVAINMVAHPHPAQQNMEV